jgi:predicted nucleic acid-binding protein
MIISDAGSIIIFARIGQLSLLREVTGSLLAPDAVYDEIVVKKGGMPGAAEAPQAARIQKASVANRSITTVCRAFCTKESAKPSPLPRSEARSCWLTKFAPGVPPLSGEST